MRERGDTEPDTADSKGGLALLPPEIMAHVVSFLNGADHASCRLASRLFCVECAVALAARAYARRPRALVASQKAPLDAIVSVFAQWRREPDLPIVATAASSDRTEVVRWALDSFESQWRRRASATKESFNSDPIHDSSSGSTGNKDSGNDGTDDAKRRATDACGLVQITTNAIAAGCTSVIPTLVCESWLLARGQKVLQEADMLADAVPTAPLSAVVAAVSAFCRRGWDQPPGAVLSVGVFYAMDAGRADTAAWLHARPEIRRRDGQCMCERVAGERAFRLRRVDWLTWLDDVGCRGRYWPADDTVPLAVRMGDGALVKWAITSSRATGVDCSVHEASLAVAMRNGGYEALCALDDTGVAPFASWPSLLLAVANPCIDVQAVRHIAARGGPYGIDVLERAVAGGRVDVLDYLLSNDGPATAAEAVGVVHDFDHLLASCDRGWQWEAAARGLEWLRNHLANVGMISHANNDNRESWR
ncbi:hypothetical protein pqer_cds_967 [Pandoravirus quercus]|uniref:F-box incomplete domain containing protein n=2 Tax=Pandoravirus TaxID=2060084 RepID=A0A2U7UAD3_9VIRU|nr:hypothetical protein pqer_cds_967 [Pandoravirus quercus]AVK75389.1 hypothetical protein pqer_cds_967 [Pandoravirus quercus]QBZ81567.1 hypothetical protein pclt_cds_981 [Pandoravirus celtis]